MPSLVFQLYIASLENVNSVKSGSSSDSYSRVGHHNDRGNHRIFDENKNWGSRDEDHPDRDDNEVSFTEKVGKQEKNCVCALLYFVVVFFFKPESSNPPFTHTLRGHEQDTNINIRDHFY